jgi:hypothetical protein
MFLVLLVLLMLSLIIVYWDIFLASHLRAQCSYAFYCSRGLFLSPGNYSLFFFREHHVSLHTTHNTQTHTIRPHAHNVLASADQPVPMVPSPVLPIPCY